MKDVRSCTDYICMNKDIVGITIVKVHVTDKVGRTKNEIYI
ncbi:hypothetical protein JOC93_003840 [Priestia taiwanensis]|uniref:Uncharacterized protein n=1 Tax=Priestia taiwanensis TaxID=1347902 RepID=A0A917AXP4_9BACI|nr:hypothetical protein [Priestia taiwanensis]GGE84749.1 hypothetical protein GCM10007140_37830 [Priestia taiwanensis]